MRDEDDERRRRRLERREASNRRRGSRRRRSRADVERDIEDAYSHPTIGDTLLLIGDTIKGAITGRRN